MIASPLAISLPPVLFYALFLLFLFFLFPRDLLCVVLKVFTNFKTPRQDIFLFSSSPLLYPLSPSLLLLNSYPSPLFIFPHSVPLLSTCPFIFSSPSILFPPLFPSSPFSSPPLHSFQYSAGSIVSGLVVCPLKRSGGITPLIPL